tara:strand:- start:2884 stop:4317 length:1434 start_codon:yes stop_codon:yes gene_type:complete
MTLDQNKESFLSVILIITLTASFIFLWGVKFGNFQLRLIILILLVPSTIKIFKDLKKKNFTFLKYFIILSLFLSLQIIVNLILEQKIISSYSLFGTLFFLSLFVISYYYNEIINYNLDLLINIFFLIFFTSSFLAIFNYKNDVPFFCGGIPNFLGITTFIDETGERVLVDLDKPHLFNISFREYIFSENSHLAMMAPGVLAYSIFKSIDKKSSNLFKFSTILFFLICAVKSSTTLLLGVPLSLLFIIFSNFKIISKKTLFIYILIIIGSFTIIMMSKECMSRLPSFNKLKQIYTIDSSKIILNLDRVIVTEPNKRLSGGSGREIKENLVNKLNNFLNLEGSLSSSVFLHSIVIAKKSFINKPFGWGLNRYDQAFNYYNKKISLQPEDAIDYLYNNKDASNNFVKILVEFGFLSLFFYFFIIVYSINRLVPLEHKLFFIPLIIVQSIRGAGYFNGGFALIIFLILFSYINSIKSNKIK